MIVFNPRKSSRKRALSSFSPLCNFFLQISFEKICKFQNYAYLCIRVKERRFFDLN